MKTSHPAKMLADFPRANELARGYFADKEKR
jgi:hypothetical protein